MQRDRLAVWPARQRGLVQLLAVAGDRIGEPPHKGDWIAVGNPICQDCAGSGGIERQRADLAELQDAAREATRERLATWAKDAIVSDGERALADSRGRVRRSVRQANVAPA
jgi:hypothetical protein